MVSSHGIISGKLVWVLGPGMELTCPLIRQRNTHVNKNKRKIHTSVPKQHSVLTWYLYRTWEHQYLRIGLRGFSVKFPQGSKQYMICVSIRHYRLWEFGICRFCSVRQNEEIMIQHPKRHRPKRHLFAPCFLQMGFYDGVKCMMLTEIIIHLYALDNHSLEGQSFAHSFLSVRANLNSYLPTTPERPH